MSLAEYRKSVQVVAAVLEQSTSHKSREFYRLFSEAMIREIEAQHSDLSSINLSPLDISELLSRKATDYDEERRYIDNNLLKRLQTDLETFNQPLRDALKKEGLRHYLVPVKTQGEGRRKHYGLKSVEVSESPEGRDQEQNYIDYEQVLDARPNILGRALQRIVLEGPKWWVYVAIPVVPMLVMLCAFQILWFQQNYSALVLFLAGLVLCYLVWREVSPFYMQDDRAFSLAPIWMLPFKCPSALIEQSRNEDDVRVLEYKVYESSCLVCGSKVYLDKGQGEFKGRIVGKCSSNGVEHVYSFDPKTCKGAPLRRDTYLG